MQEKEPIEIIKKKVTSRIEYKIKWNTGTITYEPMVELTPKMLTIVNSWEWNEHQKKKNEKAQKAESKILETVGKAEEQLPQSPPPPLEPVKHPEPSRIEPHKARQSMPKVVNQLSQNIGLATVAQVEQSIPQPPQPPLEPAKLSQPIIIVPHKARQSNPGVVKSLRKNIGQIEFLIILKEEGMERWAGLEEVKTKIPVALCDYLLQKVKFGGK